MQNNNLKFSYIFVILLVLNITILLTSNIISSKFILIFGLSFTAGDLLFPITYILNDVFVEVYGYKKSKFVIYVSFICNLIMSILFYITILLPYPKYYTDQNSLLKILMFSPRMLLASFLAYIVGSILNAKIMSKLKNKKSSKLYIRTITSTLIGELFDTIIFVFISFIGSIKNTQLFTLCINIYLLKILIEIMFTPITYFIIDKIKRKEECYE